MCGVYSGLRLPRRVSAIWVASRPSVLPVASTTSQLRSRVCGCRHVRLHEARGSARTPKRRRPGRSVAHARCRATRPGARLYCRADSVPAESRRVRHGRRGTGEPFGGRRRRSPRGRIGRIAPAVAPHFSASPSANPVGRTEERPKELRDTPDSRAEAPRTRSASARSRSARRAAAQSGGGGGAVYVRQAEVTKVSLRRGAARRASAPRAAARSSSPAPRSTASPRSSSAAATGAATTRRAVRSAPAATRRLSVKRADRRGHRPDHVGDRAGASRSRPTKPSRSCRRRRPSRTPSSAPVPGRCRRCSSRPAPAARRPIVGARRAVTFSFRCPAPRPTALAVELVRASDGAAVKTWTPGAVEPGEVTSSRWNGRIGSAGAKPGRYSFRLTAPARRRRQVRSAAAGTSSATPSTSTTTCSPSAAATTSAAAARASARAARATATRARTCSRAAAPRWSRRAAAGCKFKQYHAAAGNYLVIDAAGTASTTSTCTSPSPRRSRPATASTRASASARSATRATPRGCHLHFELWRGPGWYDGGKPFDPLPSLHAWDAWS